MSERIGERDPVVGKWEIYRCAVVHDHCVTPWISSYEPPNGEYHDWMSQEFPTHAEAIAYADRMAQTNQGENNE